MNPVRTTRITRACAVMSSLLVASFLSGCGERTTYPISGKVTYQGKPVPAGAVMFVPDHSCGNQGLSVTAAIKNGSFATEAGTGVFSGPYTVTVYGNDGKPVATSEGGWEERGQPLFAPYETKADLPAQEHVLNIDVPASVPAKEGRASPGGGG
jgi:hypothetical protein